MYCKECGTENPMEARFCKNCGFSFILDGKELYQPIPIYDFAKIKSKRWFISLGSVLIITIVLTLINVITIPIMFIQIFSIVILLLVFISTRIKPKIIKPETVYLTSSKPFKLVVLTNQRIIVATKRWKFQDVILFSDIANYCASDSYLNIRLHDKSDVQLLVTKPEVWVQAIKLIKNH